MLEVDQIKKELKKKMSGNRYEHSLRVAEEAKNLAKIYNCNEEKAYLAGLIHDVAKEFNDEENKKWIKSSQISEDLLKSKFTRTIHAEIGAVVAKKLFGLDNEICEAIRYHTVGNIKMNLLAKIIFVADKIESGKKYLGIEEERILAYQNIDEALILCLQNQLQKREKEGKKMHPDSLKLLDYLTLKQK